MFKIVKILGGRMNVPETIKLEAGSSTASTVTEFKDGQALTFSSGLLAPASGSATVDFVCAENKKITGSGKLQVYKVTPDMIFEVETSAVPSGGVVPGTHYTVDTTGMKVTGTAVTVATTASSVTNPYGARVIDKQGASAAGDKVLVTLA